LLEVLAGLAEVENLVRWIAEVNVHVEELDVLARVLGEEAAVRLVVLKWISTPEVCFCFATLSWSTYSHSRS
jgi:hypothetical protein